MDVRPPARPDAVRAGMVGAGRTPSWLLGKIEAEARHLIELEDAGNSAATPLLSIAEVLLVIIPALVFMLGLALLAYYVIG
jgi:hypothetical protein